MKLLYLITEDWFFCSHFLERAIAAKADGYEVVIVANESEHGAVIRNAGLRFVPLNMQRRSMNPFVEIKTLFAIWRIYREESPDIFHHIALKPILYGSLIARFMRKRRIINAPVGMGYVFSSKDLMARILKHIVATAIRFLLNPPDSKVIFENSDDQESSIDNRVVRREDTILIRGAGIDLQQYMPLPEPVGQPIVMLTARMLWDKGIREFVGAAKLLQKRGCNARFVLVGGPDEGNPAAIPVTQLRAWEKEGAIEWLGQRNDIAMLLSQCHIVCLPSYREGLPKSLLEAIAAGKPVVTTDVPGCREVIKNDDNGLLVRVRDENVLADALERLIDNPMLRARYGMRGRERAENEFGSELVIAATLKVYNLMSVGP